VEKEVFDSRRKEGFSILLQQLLVTQKTLEEIVNLYGEAACTLEDVAPLNISLRRTIEEAQYQLRTASVHSRQST